MCDTNVQVFELDIKNTLVSSKKKKNYKTRSQKVCFGRYVMQVYIRISITAVKTQKHVVDFLV
jgi:hypothetical protein